MEAEVDRWSVAATVASTVPPQTESIPGPPGRSSLQGRSRGGSAFQHTGEASTSEEDGSSDDDLVRGGNQRAAVDEDPAFNYAGWRRICKRNRLTFIILTVVDIVYVLVLLGLRLTYGTHNDGPDSPAAQFFIGRPCNLKIPFLVVAVCTDAVVVLAALRNYSPLLSLFVMWSVILVAFAIMAMPLLFLFLRVSLVVGAFQLRYSISRMRNMMAPTNLAEWIFSAGQGVSAGAHGAASTLAAPFRWAARRRNRTNQPATADVEAGTAAGDIPPPAAQAHQTAIAARQRPGRQRRSSTLQLWQRASAVDSAAPGVADDLAGPEGVQGVRSATDHVQGRSSDGREQQQRASSSSSSEDEGHGAAPATSHASGAPGSRRQRRSRSTLQPVPGGAASLREMYQQLMSDLEAIRPRPGPGGTSGADVEGSSQQSMYAAAAAQLVNDEGASGGVEAGPSASRSLDRDVELQLRGRQQQQEADTAGRSPRLAQQQRRRRRRLRGGIPLVTVEVPE
ncbi:hypothetical protein N2152v2_008808 [Parachlorella kessleri]